MGECEDRATPVSAAENELRRRCGVGKRRQAAREVEGVGAQRAQQRATPKTSASGGAATSCHENGQPGKNLEVARNLAWSSARVADSLPEIRRVFYGGMPPDDDPSWGEKALNKIPCLKVGLP